MEIALFGIEDDTVNTAINLLALALAFIYLALIVWTYLDARRRIDDQILVGSAAAGALVLPFLGSMIYSILRPPELLDDARERELETRAAELRVRQLEEQACPSCGYPIERSFLRCPQCRARIKDPCESCGKPVDPRWSLCPYCEAPVARRTSRRAASGAASGQEEAAGKEAPAEQEAAREPARQGSGRQASKQGSGRQASKQGSGRQASRQGSNRQQSKRGSAGQRSGEGGEEQDMGRGDSQPGHTSSGTSRSQHQ